MGLKGGMNTGSSLLRGPAAEKEKGETSLVAEDLSPDGPVTELERTRRLSRFATRWLSCSTESHPVKRKTVLIQL